MSSLANPPKPLVAIIDDNDGFREAMSRVLDAAGFATKSYPSVAEFIRSGVLAQIGCLLLDVAMPDIDGFALQECLQETNYDLPIVFCSGTRDDDVVTRALANGAVSFIRKPVDVNGLIESVRNACNSRAHAGKQ